MDIMNLYAYQTEYKNKFITIQSSDYNEDPLTSNDLFDIFEYLLIDYDDPGLIKTNHLKYAWDLDEFVAPLLRGMGRELAVELYKNKRFFIKPYSLFYIPNKVFCVKSIHRNYTARIYGIKYFFPEDKHPESFEELEFFGKYLWEQLKLMGYRPTKLTSPIAVYQECVMKGLSMPGVDSMPRRVAELAYSCSGRLWVEAHKLGHFNQTWDYDLRSAFPNAAKEMLDTRLCEYLEDTNYHPEAEYGYIYGDITIYDNVTIHPIIHDTNRELISPIGTWAGTITKGEYDFIYKWRIGEVKIKEAHWVIPVRRVRPLFTVMDRLLQKKDKGGVIKHIAKLQATGIYGKFGEEHEDSFGDYFNPIWFAEISTRTRLKVAEFIYRNKLMDNVIHIGVDGVLLDKPVEVNDDWRLDGEQEEAIIISSGLAYHGTYRQAGFNIESIKTMFSEHPNLTYYQDFRTRRVTIGDISQGVEFEKLGQEYRLPTSIDLNPERDRVYLPKPATGGQILRGVYTSKPKRV